MSARPLTTVIVDDEFLARERLKELLGEHGDVVVVAEAASADEALQFIESHHPDLLLLDISLPRMDGFELLSCVRSDLPVVIFTTAYDEHAIRAFEVEAADYVLKPIERERLAKALQRARSRIGATQSPAAESVRRLIDAGTTAFSSRARIVVRADEKIVFLRPQEIDAVEAVGNYVRIHRGAEKFVIRRTLSGLEERLSPHGFARIQRSVLVNVESIAELQRDAGDGYVVVLTSGIRFRLSPHYRDNLARLLGEF